MHKDIKLLTELSQCTYLSKRVRDAIIFLLRETGNIKVEPGKGFLGLDFSSWLSLPKKSLIEEWIQTRKSTKKTIITQTFIDTCAPHLKFLHEQGVSVNEAIGIAANNGWQRFCAKWVLDEIEKNKLHSPENEIFETKLTEKGYINKILLGEITHISQIKEYQNIMSHNYAMGEYDAEIMQALTNIGFAA